MLIPEENEILTRVGPGTVMGDLLRQYWVPALMSNELPGPDCPPVRVRLLGESLIAFRVTSGGVGLIQDACPHRAASFFFGRNEEDGIRCAYHGWKFDITGQCVDMLSEPEDSNFHKKVKATVYPCDERGGLVWTYMGPKEVPPPLPDLEANMMPEGRGNLRAMMLEWNWVQIMENGMDTAHQGILHFGSVPYEEAIDPEKAQQAYPGPVEDLKYIVYQGAPRIEVRDTEYGISYDGWRNTPEGDVIYHRTMHWLWPWYCMFPVQKLGTAGQANICVPMDDTHTMVWNMSTGRVDGSSDSQRSTRTTATGGSNAALAGNMILPNTPDWYGRFRAAWWEETKNAGTFDFGVDRQVQKTSHTTTGFSGLASVPLQDGMINWSQGTIVDRSKEHLGTSDRALIRVRRRLLEAARSLRENGGEAPAVDSPELYRQRSGWILLPGDVDYWEATRYMREAFLNHQTAPAPYTPGPLELAEAPKQLV